jgi:ribosome-interacting GTPase 1
MPLSGMMPFEDIQFQLIDLPPIGNESTDGWVSGILRNANVLMLVVDLSEDADIQAELLLDQLSEWKIRVAKEDDKDRQREVVRSQ